jgi:CRP-like cAMP-binding protein
MEDRRLVREAADFLLSTDVFTSLSLAEATVLSTFLERRSVEAGDEIVRQGDPSDDLYLIESGNVEVHVTALNGESRLVDVLQRGDHFGEVALVTGGRRMATVTATVPTAVLRLSGPAYAEYLSQTGDVSDRLSETATTRVAEAQSSPGPE